jgi:hypothetical protein
LILDPLQMLVAVSDPDVVPAQACQEFKNMAENSKFALGISFQGFESLRSLHFSPVGFYPSQQRGRAAPCPQSAGPSHTVRKLNNGRFDGHAHRDNDSPTKHASRPI